MNRGPPCVEGGLLDGVTPGVKSAGDDVEQGGGSGSGSGLPADPAAEESDGEDYDPAAR